MKRVLGVTLIAAALVILPLPARADITGPCTASINGANVKTGHGTPGTAVKIPYDSTASVGGSVAGTARGVRYQIELAGIQRDVPVTVQTRGNRSSWSGNVEISKYAWATVGLFKVTGVASTSAGRCSGFVYICITGKSPFTTAAGGAGTAVFLGGLIMLAVTIAHAKDRAAGASAVRAFFPALLMAEGVVLLLQQSCVAPLNVPTAALIPIAAGIGGGALVPVVGGLIGAKPPPGGYAPQQPAWSPPAPGPDEATRVTLNGPAAINTLIASGATQVPGTIFVRPPDKDLPGILGTSFTTKKIPDPADPGRMIDVIDPSSVIVLAQPGNVPAPAPEPNLAPPAPAPTPPPAVPPSPAPPAPTPPPSVPPPSVPVALPATKPEAVIASPPPAPPPKPEEHPLIKKLLQPGGGNATIPPGNVAPLVPPQLRDTDGNIRVPDKAPIPGWARGFINGEPPPNLAIEPHGGLVITPAGKLSEFVGKVTLSKVRARIEVRDGRLSGFGRFETALGSKDVTKDIEQGLGAFNKALDKANLKVTSLKVDGSGIHITTGPR